MKIGKLLTLCLAVLPLGLQAQQADLSLQKFDIIVLGGQSNAEGYGLGEVREEYKRNENILWLNDSSNPHFAKNEQTGKDEFKIDYPSPFTLTVADEPGEGKAKTGKLSLSFAKEYYRKYLAGTDRKLLILNAAVGGTGFVRNEWGTTGILYRRLCDMTEYALRLNKGNRLVAVLWHQGECDSFETAGWSADKKSQTHKGNLTGQFDDFETRFSCPNLPMIAAGFCDEWYLKNKAGCDPILKAIREVFSGDSRAFVETGGLKSNHQAGVNDDDIHFCREALHYLGNAYFQAFEGLKVNESLGSQVVHISTPGTSLVLNAPKGGKLVNLYYGEALKETDLDNITSAHPATYTNMAYADYGVGTPYLESSIAATFPDGNMSLELVVENVSEQATGNGKTTVITLKDKFYPFCVDVCYRTYQGLDVIEAWTEIYHQLKKPVVLRQFDSAALPIRRGNVWLSHLGGFFMDETQLTQEALVQGMKVIKNTDGVRNSASAHAEIMLSLDGKPQENTGRVIGAALCYSGNYEIRIDTREHEYHFLHAGICADNSAYTLPNKERFVTPALALTYSHEGLSGSSRNFHRWARQYKIAHGNELRRILLNSWEGIYCNVNEKDVYGMMEDIASIGGELFVLDDGWFGGKYQRNDDQCALGDWVVDTRKLPEGFDGLLAKAKELGIKFGVWLEPEMVVVESELYEKHPDWVVKAPNRELSYGRGDTQMVLDLSNPAVQDYIFRVFDDLLTKYPDIAYIKWDSNMSIQNFGSQYLGADKQSHLFIEYHRGFAKVCERIRAKYPDLTIQACASGGGRASYGVLPWFDEFWASDNSDALQRVYIQWGTSYFFPAMTMAAHISAVPNHQTHRVIPLKYRIDVAMSGRLGMELQPKNMTSEELDFCKKAIAEYKEIRPIVQLGDIYRLLSPYEKQSVASLMYVTPEKERAVFFWWKTENFRNHHLPRIPMAGLDAAKHYRVRELNRIDNRPLPFEGKIFSGAYLMANGLDVPYTHSISEEHVQNDYASRVLLLEEVK